MLRSLLALCLIWGLRGCQSMQDITIESAVSVRPGACLVYRFHQHSSVGIEAEYQIADPAIVRFKTQETRYHHPEKLQPGWTGGDSAEGQFIFEALKPGTTVLRFQHVFRGEREREHTVTVEVQSF